MPLPRNFPTPQHLRDAFDNYKEWAKNNPQKFIENLQHVQNLLKK